MKHLGRLVIVTALLLTLFTVLAPASPVHAACEIASGSGTQSGPPIQLDPTHSYTLNISAGYGPFHITASIVIGSGKSLFPNPPAYGEYLWSLSDNTMDCSGVAFRDGRINNSVGDTNQTVAVYCLMGKVQVLSTKGQVLFSVSRSEISRLTPQSKPQLIKQKNGVRLYLLETGELQLNAPPLEKGKPDYTVIFNNCA